MTRAYIARSLILLMLLAVSTPAPARPGLAGAAAAPAPPRKSVTPLPPEDMGARQVMVRAGDDLQARINAARPGDTLVLAAGATWTGNFNLPARSDNGWITIRTSDLAGLPRTGERVSPSHAVNMPKILTPNSNAAISAADGTEGWRLIGLEISAVPTWPNVVYQLVVFGWGSQPHGKRAPADRVASRLIVERSYIHGSQTQKVRRGLLVNGADIRISDSWIDEIHDSGFDSQAILAYDGPGPYLIENNELQAASENIMLGGADSSRADLIPSDVTIRRNHIIKPWRWKPDHPSHDGRAWVIKPLIELKSAQRVLIEGNILENSWGWPAFVCDAFNQDNSAPWSVVQDVTFQFNLIKEVTSVFQAWSGSAPVRRVALLHNNAIGVSIAYKAGAYVTGKQFRLVGGAPIEDVWIEHNTSQPTDNGPFTLDLSKGSFPRFTYRNNIVGFGAAGPTVEGHWTGEDWALDMVAPGRDFKANALVSLGSAPNANPRKPNTQSVWPAPQWISVPDAKTAGLNPDGTLTPNSPLRRRATDGTDLGVDFAALSAALKGDRPPDQK